MKGGRDEGKQKNPDPRAARLEASVSCFGLVEIIIVQSSRTEKMSSLFKMLSYKNRDWHDLSKCILLLELFTCKLKTDDDDGIVLAAGFENRM